MRYFWTDRRFLVFSAVTLLGCAIQPVWAQRGGNTGSSNTGAGAGAGSPGNVGTPGRGTGSVPSSFPGSLSNSPTMNRPIFLSGKVLFDDGSPANTDIRIERVCGASPRLEAHTDSKGRFSFQVGQNLMVDTDASDDSLGGGTFGGRSPGQLSSPNGFGGSGNQMNPLWNCELRAAYPGYRSDVVELASRRSLDDPDVGTIVLHRLSNVQGTTISLTTALAPKHAVKSYEKGVQLEAKGKLEEAEKQLTEATTTYPKYAMAWFELGQVQRKQGRADDARKSCEAAIAADSKYVSPYDQLALIAAQQGRWEEAANFSKHVIQLNPVEFPMDFWLNAVANYNLKKPAEAEKSTQELLKLDTRHKFPEAENMMAQLMLDKGNYPEAAAHLRAYLALAPNAKNADSLKQALLKIEQANAEVKK
jgi:tetratricopeptide (TPR) repeat protein